MDPRISGTKSDCVCELSPPSSEPPRTTVDWRTPAVLNKRDVVVVATGRMTTRTMNGHVHLESDTLVEDL